MNSSRPICVMVNTPYGKRVHLVKEPDEGEYRKVGNNLYVKVDDDEEETLPKNNVEVEPPRHPHSKQNNRHRGQRK